MWTIIPRQVRGRSPSPQTPFPSQTFLFCMSNFLSFSVGEDRQMSPRGQACSLRLLTYGREAAVEAEAFLPCMRLALVIRGIMGFSITRCDLNAPPLDPPGNP